MLYEVITCCEKETVVSTNNKMVMQTARIACFSTKITNLHTMLATTRLLIPGIHFRVSSSGYFDSLTDS